MSEYNAKNYSEQGGDKMVIGGRLEIAPGGTLDVKSGATFSNENGGGSSVMPYLANSTQSSASNLVKDLNALLTFIRDAGLMASEAPTLSITTQPQGASVDVNGTASLTVAASCSDGRTLTYQWYSNASNANTGGTKITGATSATYEPPTTGAGTVYYYCVVSDGSGAATAAMEAATSSAVSVVVS